MRFARIAFLCVGVPPALFAQGMDAVPHGVECHALTAGAKPPAIGCVIVGERILEKVPRGPLYWHLTSYATQKAADAAAKRTDIVANVEGRYWVYSVASRNGGPRGGRRVAKVGPLPMPRRRPFVLTAATAVLPPGANSIVHTHDGPEAWYLLAGEQCLETPSGVKRAGRGQSMLQPGYIPMQLDIVGHETRRALFIVLHDSATSFANPSDWKPKGLCTKP
jgi:quercetin dioxygenase-like cupin family protein